MGDVYTLHAGSWNSEMSVSCTHKAAPHRSGLILQLCTQTLLVPTSLESSATGRRVTGQPPRAIAKLGEQVLRGLGWDILRIWSTDWWVDQNGTLDRIHAKLAALLEVIRKRRAEEAETAAAKEAAEAALQKAKRLHAGSPVA